jgi:hypothetical protein
MAEALLLLAAVLANFAGMAWLALAMEAHWEQVRGSTTPLAAGTASAMRLAATLAIAAALVLCLRADHPTMAVLVWIMTLTGAAVTVSLALAWRPATLAPMVAWVRR